MFFLWDGVLYERKAVSSRSAFRGTCHSYLLYHWYIHLLLISEQTRLIKDFIFYG